MTELLKKAAQELVCDCAEGTIPLLDSPASEKPHRAFRSYPTNRGHHHLPHRDVEGTQITLVNVQRDDGTKAQSSCSIKDSRASHLNSPLQGYC